MGRNALPVIPFMWVRDGFSRHDVCRTCLTGTGLAWRMRSITRVVGLLTVLSMPPALGQNCFVHGANINCDNGIVGRYNRGTKVFSDGSSAHSNGNKTTFSNGISAERNGSTTIFSNGHTAYTNGNKTEYSNGLTCYYYGANFHCNQR